MISSIGAILKLMLDIQTPSIIAFPMRVLGLLIMLRANRYYEYESDLRDSQMFKQSKEVHLETLKSYPEMDHKDLESLIQKNLTSLGFPVKVKGVVTSDFIEGVLRDIQQKQEGLIIFEYPDKPILYDFFQRLLTRKEKCYE